MPELCAGWRVSALPASDLPSPNPLPGCRLFDSGRARLIINRIQPVGPASRRSPLHRGTNMHKSLAIIAMLLAASAAQAQDKAETKSPPEAVGLYSDAANAQNNKQFD